MQHRQAFIGALALITILNVGVAAAAARACEARVLSVADGTGIAAQLVSDGRHVAVTNEAGRYALPGGEAPGGVFVIARDGWTAPLGEDGLPAFWRKDCGDIRLAPHASEGSSDPLRVLVFSDPQTATEAQVDYYARGTVSAAAREPGISLGITLGDVTDDQPNLYPALNRATTSIGVPWLHAAGNHDVDIDAGDDAQALVSFRTVYGADTFAWETALASFVVLDNVVSTPGQRPAYIGGLREDQFAFLERYLALAPRDRLLVVAAHIPWFDTAAAGRPATVRSEDRARLFALLREFPHVLLLSGHRHTQRQFFHDAGTGWHGASRLHEYNVGAVSGAYWSGEADEHGIPDATMADGTPKGHAVLTINAGGRYQAAWRPVGLPADNPSLTDVMALHAPKVLRSGAYPAWGVYANVYLGHDDTRVEYRIAGEEWRPMTRVDAPDPRLLVMNAQDDLADALRGRDRSPEAEPSTHLWRGALDTRRPPGEYDVDVRTFDDAGEAHRASLRYRLLEWKE